MTNGAPPLAMTDRPLNVAPPIFRPSPFILGTNQQTLQFACCTLPGISASSSDICVPVVTQPRHDGIVVVVLSQHLAGAEIDDRVLKLLGVPPTRPESQCEDTVAV